MTWKIVGASEASVIYVYILIRKLFYQQNESTIETPKPQSNQSKRGKKLLPLSIL